MYKTIRTKAWFAVMVVLVSCASAKMLSDAKKPVLYIIGDSTVKNDDGTGKRNQWGWGSFIATYFDTLKISVRNHAIGGRSSRTFITEGRWDNILATLKKGDYVIMQFGHNDDWPLDDTARARGSIKGIGQESRNIYNPITKKRETVYSYGHYMRQYIADAKAKGALPIVCSRVPGNSWRNDKVSRVNKSYGLWAQQVAQSAGVPFIDLNDLIADKYETLGADAVGAMFATDRTHTNLEGAKLNAAIVIDALKDIQPGKLTRYLHN